MNRILVLNVGNYWHPNAKASVVAAADRWGCELIEITSKLGARDMFQAKFKTWQFCHAQGRCIFMDGDMVVRSDTLSPLDLVPETHMGGVLNFQGDTHDGDATRYQVKSWMTACDQLGRSTPYSNDKYINGGLVLYSHQHIPVLKKLDTMTDTSGCNEQAAWSVMMAETPTVYLPREFNRVGNAVWESGARMSAYVYHFASYFDYRPEQKAAHIAATHWSIT